jgi:tight adherence protein C
MELFIAVATFVTVSLTLYGLLYRTTGMSAIDDRLGGLRFQRPGKQALPDPDAAFKVRVLAPLVANLSGRITRMLPSAMAERMELSLIQAGLKIQAAHFLLICAVLATVVPLLAALYLLSGGATTQKVLMVWAAFTGAGIYGPRMWLLGRIKRRKKDIWRSLPDAFDLITASVEAGLGIDAALNRVVEKVKGPFAEELSKALREISMGRARREALAELSDRTGVEELRSLINAIIQAEAMGISIGSVVRVQTGVLRTKRRQKAEEQAFKAPIKMVFPLVFFIFPAIMVVIGGPALIQLQGGIGK